MPESTDEGEFVCIFGSHLTKPNRSSLVTFNTRLEAKLIAETDYRRYGVTACLNGKIMDSLSEQFC